MAKKNFKPGDKVELADKDVGFYDSETNFKIVRSQKEELPDPIGKKTNVALMSGGLLVVGKGKSDAGKSAEAEVSAEDLAKQHKRKELEQMAKDAGLDGNSYTNKQELAEAIIAAK